MKTDGSGARFPGWKTLSGIRSLRRVSLAVSFCLSFLLILACNLWTYETERIRLEEGDWHVRIVQPVSQEQKQQMLASAWISSLQETETEDGKPVTELIFARPQKLYEQLPELEQLTGLDPDAVQVHDLLLSRMLITDPQDPSPPLLLPAMLALLVLCLLALILVLKSAYTQILATHIRTLASLHPGCHPQRSAQHGDVSLPALSLLAGAGRMRLRQSGLLPARSDHQSVLQKHCRPSCRFV